MTCSIGNTFATVREPRPGIPAMSGTREISRREVLAYEEKRLAGKPCDRVREAVAEVEVCAMSAASKPAVGNERLAPVRLAEGHLGDVELIEHAGEQGT